MNAFSKTKTTSKSKITALLSLLLLLNFATAWGQEELPVPSTSSGNNTYSSTHYIKCGTYSVVTAALQTYNSDRTYIYTFQNNTGSTVTISDINLNTVRYGNNNNNIDYIRIYNVNRAVNTGYYDDYGESTGDYSSNPDRCHNQSGSDYDIFAKSYYPDDITLPSGQYVIFRITKGVNSNLQTGCTPVGFSATITGPACCPDCPTLTETISTTDGATSAILRWDEVSDNATYSVAVTKDGGVSSSYSAGTDESLELNNLTDGTYTWTLTFIAGGCTVTCDTRTFTVCSSLSCVDPNSMTPSGGDEVTSRLLSWDPVPCADKYTVYVAPTSVGIGNLTTSTDNRIYKKEVTTTELQLPIMAQGDYYWTVIPENTSSGLKATGCNINSFSIRYASSDDHDISPSTQGTDFFFSLMQNGYRGNDSENDKYKAIIAPKEDAIVTFYYYENQTQDTFHVRSGRTREITLQEALVYHDTPGGQLNRTVHVTSTADISLYISNEADNSFDASIVLPTTALGANYMIQTYPSNKYNSSNWGAADYSEGLPCFMIIATKDNTVVNISGNNSGNLSPNATSVVLNEGESYFVKSNSENVIDLSGLKINVAPRNGHPEDSCKTIAVFNGNVATCIPNDLGNNRDHLVEQAYPISNWGTEFAITSTDGYIPSTDNADVDYIRITAAEATSGTINDGGTQPTTFTLAAGATYEYKLHHSKGSCYIKTEKPVACYLYQRSSKQISINSSTENDNMGDPSMVWIAPIERGIEKITFSTFKATDIRDTNHWVNIVIPADALDIRTSGRDERKTVWLGNRDITSSFATGGTLNYVKGSNNKYAYARVKINHGTYTVYSNCGAKMVLHVYGLGNVRGYAYNAGSAAVPYKSAFSIGDGEREFDMTALPEDYHFCSGQKYVFRVSSNGNIDSVIFDFQNGERRKKVITPENDTIHHTITQGGDYRIISYVFSTVYNHDFCQKEIVVDTVEDHTYIFLSSAETVNDSVCYGVPYTYTRQIWTHNENDSLVLSTFTHDFNTAYTGSQTLHIEHARSQYGCDIDLTINLKVFGEMKPGTIGSREIKCQEGAGGSVNLSVTELTDAVSASGGPSDAHYEWQKKTIVSINGTDTTWSDWTTIAGQTEATYIVVEAGRYRRVYKSGFCNQEYFSNEIFVKQAGSFDPGDHIDETIEVCNYQTVTRNIGGNIASSSILGNATDGYYVVVPNGGTTETIYLSFQWQKAEGTLPATDAGWTDITTNGNGYNYSINSTFTTNTYFRRLIDATGSSCELNLSMGVFGIVVKPDYNVSIKKLSGCYNQNNAKAVFDIKYADSTTGNFNISYAGPEGTTSGTAVANGNKYETGTMYQGVDYTYTVVDATYGCEKTGTVNIANPAALTVANAESKSACQGSPIDLPIPAISGGDMPYSVTITSTGLGIVEARPIQVEVNTNSATTTSYNVPMDVTPEAKTLGYVIRDVNNCRVASDQTVVTIEKVPAFDLSNTDLTSCEAAKVDATITATVTNATGSPKYDYQINYGSFNADNKTSATHTFGAATAGGGLPQGVYNITVIDENTNNKCSATKEHEIKSNFVPTVVLAVQGLTMIATNQYSGCPNKNITVSVSAINSTPIGNIADNTYQYSIDGINYGDDYSFQTKTLNKCGSQTISVYVKEVSTGCIFKQDLSIIIEDGIIPTIDASLTNMDVTTYFCPTYTIPEVEDIKNNIKAYISDNCASDDDLSVSVTPNTGTFNVADGAQTVTITVKDLCGNTATKQITITPKPWPNFKINGIATNGTDNDCYCHGDNITLTAVLEDGTDISYEGASYQWYKVTTDNNGDEVSTSITNGGRYSGADTKELKISSAISTDDDPTNGDDGVYKLVITDPKGCTKEATIMICVHPNIKFNLE